MTTANSRAVDEARIRGLIDEWANALRAKDADGILRHFAPDVGDLRSRAAAEVDGRGL